MATLFKVFTIIMISIVMLLGVSLFLLSHYIDPNKVKSQISAAVYRHTGRQLTIGSLSWSVFPEIGFTITDAKIESTHDFNNTPLAEIGTAKVNVRLLPLLFGKVRVNHITLYNSQLNLIRYARDNDNWSDRDRRGKPDVMLTNNSNTTSHKPALTKLRQAKIDFSIAHLTVANSRVHWLHQTTQQSYTLSHVYLEGKNIGTQRSSPLSIRFHVAANQLTNTFAASLRGNLTIDDQLNALAIDQLQMCIEPLQPAGNNTIINGKINVTNLQEQQFTFHLNADAITIDDYLPKKSRHANKTNEPIIMHQLQPTASRQTALPNPSPVKKVSLAQSPRHALDGQGVITINHLVIANLHFNKAQLHIEAHDGIFTILPFSADLYTGGISGNARFNRQTTNPRYQLAMTAKELQVQTLLHDLMDKRVISGTANFSVNLLTDGNTIQSLRNHLSGNGKFTLSNGTINGINVKYQLARANALLHKTAMPTSPQNNTTTFGKVTGNIQLNHGVVTNNDLQITNKDFTAAGKGRVNLNRASVDYKLVVKPKGGALKEYHIPLIISGILNSPLVTLDIDDILQQVLQRQQQRLVKQAKQHLEKSLGNLFAR